MASGQTLEDTTHARVPSDNEEGEIETPQVQPGEDDQFDPDDMDAAELKEALEAAEAEKAAANDEFKEAVAEEQGKTRTPDTPEGSQAQGQEAPQEQQPGPMIPKQRFDQIAKRAYEAEQKIAHLQGRLEGMSAAQQFGRSPQSQQGHGQPQPQPQQRQTTPEELIAQIRERGKSAAKRFDDGEITAVELEEIRSSNEDALARIREYQFAQRMKREQEQSQPAKPAVSDLYLDERTAELENRYPAIREVQDRNEIEAYRQQAQQVLQNRGVDLSQMSQGHAKLALRETVAQIAEITYNKPYREARAAIQRLARGEDFTAVMGQQQTQQPAQSPQAQARAKKLAMAENMPPDIQAMNGAKSSTDRSYSDVELENMSDDDIAALPTSLRNKLLGIES